MLRTRDALGVRLGFCLLDASAVLYVADIDTEGPVAWHQSFVSRAGQGYDMMHQRLKVEISGLQSRQPSIRLLSPFQ